MELANERLVFNLVVLKENCWYYDFNGIVFSKFKFVFCNYMFVSTLASSGGMGPIYFGVVFGNWHSRCLQCHESFLSEQAVV